MMKLSLIGCGAWGQNYVKTIEHMEDVEINTILVRSPNKLPEWIRDRYNITTSFDEATYAQIDGVIIATPPDSHYSLTVQAFNKGFSVLLEKPISTKFEETKDLLQIVRRTDGLLQTNHIHLFSPAYLKLREIVSSWKGPLIIRSKGGNKGPFRDYDSFYDYGPHDISMILGLVNRFPDEIHINNRLGRSSEGDIFELRMKFRNITSRHFDVITDDRKINKSITSYIDVFCTVGNDLNTKARYLSVEHKENGVIVYDDTKEEKLYLNGEVVSVIKTSPLEESIRCFVNSISNFEKDWRNDPDFNQNIYDVMNLE